MKIFKKIAAIQTFLQTKKEEGKTVGFVPTMGALHSGHIRLISACKQQCDIAVASIFVNPTQFNDKADLEKYPRTITADTLALIEADCDVLFYPEVEEMYPETEITRIYDLDELEGLFEGSSRPGHFQGVCQVVDKLFTIVQPDKVFFGQKDYQQCMVIKKMISQRPAFSNIDMQIISTVREKNGLAMSSRNTRLSEKEKLAATTIYQCLTFIKDQIKEGDQNELLKKAALKLKQNGFKVDYVSIADAVSLKPVLLWDGQQSLVVLIAAFLGPVRLIDNLVIA